MLFNSFAFLFVFLPLAWLGYFGLNRLRRYEAAIVFLALASLAFYGCWNIRYVPLILATMAANYAVSARLRTLAAQGRRSRGLLALGLLIGLGALGWFKYGDFVIQNLDALLGLQWPLRHLLLPLGISFYVFEEIVFMLDSWRGLTRGTPFPHYALFVLFFPHLIAGPIIHHSEILPQFRDLRRRRPLPRWMARGLFLFAVGLCKKVVLADGLAPWARQAFDHLPALTPFQAWAGSLAYTLQLYFDFSGYSDMALGLAALFNIRLPFNFASPYRSESLRDFWRRWHITLGRFLRETIYVPLGGNRRGEARTQWNVVVTFLVGGLWHGAAWTFVFWGALHGLGQLLERLWQRLALPLPRALAWTVTLLYVHLAWVFFRAHDLASAAKVYRGMLGLGHAAAAPWLDQALALNEALHSTIDAYFTTALLALGLGLALFAPNSQALTRRLRPGWRWALATAALLVLGLMNLDHPSEFLYFNF
jgi:alginate O-acetyltransferase complex protein AlgI